MHTGVHYPGDVVVGSLIGEGTGQAVAAWWTGCSLLETAPRRAAVSSVSSHRMPRTTPRILGARPDGNLDDLNEQVAARLAGQAILDRTGAPQLW